MGLPGRGTDVAKAEARCCSGVLLAQQAGGLLQGWTAIKTMQASAWAACGPSVHCPVHWRWCRTRGAMDRKSLEALPYVRLTGRWVAKSMGTDGHALRACRHAVTGDMSASSVAGCKRFAPGS